MRREVCRTPIITDAAGNIIGVGTLADAQAAIDGAAPGDVVCVQSIVHEGLEDIVNEIDAATGGAICGLGLLGH